MWCVSKVGANCVGVDVIVFDGVAPSCDLDIFEAFDRAQEVELEICRK